MVGGAAISLTDELIRSIRIISNFHVWWGTEEDTVVPSLLTMKLIPTISFSGLLNRDYCADARNGISPIPGQTETVWTWFRRWTVNNCQEDAEVDTCSSRS